MVKNKAKVCVIGSGNGGLAAAADLSLRGHQVTLFELPEFYESINKVRESGGIYLKVLKSTGLKNGFAKLDKITTDISQALNHVEIVLIIVPAFAQKRIAKECAKFLSKNQVVVLAPGNLGGSIEFYHTVVQYGGNKDITVSEMECMMYACRKISENTVYIRGYKHHLGFSTFPAKDLERSFNKVKKIYPYIEKRNSILETGLSNSNPIVHVPILLFNISLIDNNSEVLMYREALTKSVGRIIDKVDNERCLLNELSFNFTIFPIKEIVKKWYYHQGARGDSLYKIMSENPIYYSSLLPTDLNHRYLIEDVPYGLIPMMELLRKFGVNPKTINSIIELACVVTNLDFYQSARNLKVLKFDEMNTREIIHYVNYR